MSPDLYRMESLDVNPGSRTLSNLVKEIRADHLFVVEGSCAGRFSPRQKPEITLGIGDSQYSQLRSFMLDTYSSMVGFLKREGDHFEPELFFGPGRERSISLCFEWKSLELDLFELQKEAIWEKVTEKYYGWSARARYSLISGE